MSEIVKVKYFYTYLKIIERLYVHACMRTHAEIHRCIVVFSPILQKKEHSIQTLKKNFTVYPRNLFIIVH